MSTYQHKKGKIKDNALEALLHDPLFRQRIEKNKKGKGSYCRKGKQGKGQNWEASGKSSKDTLPLASRIIYPAYFKSQVRWLCLLFGLSLVLTSNEADASDVQIRSRQIYHPNCLLE